MPVSALVTTDFHWVPLNGATVRDSHLHASGKAIFADRFEEIVAKRAYSQAVAAVRETTAFQDLQVILRAIRKGATTPHACQRARNN